MLRPIFELGIAAESDVAAVALGALADSRGLGSRKFEGDLGELLACPGLETLYRELVHADEIDLGAPAALAAPLLGRVLREVDEAQRAVHVALERARLVARVDGEQPRLDRRDVDEVLLERHGLVLAALRRFHLAVAGRPGTGGLGLRLGLAGEGGHAGRSGTGERTGEQGTTVDLAGFFGHDGATSRWGCRGTLVRQPRG